MELQGYQFIDRLHQGTRQDFWRLLPDGSDHHLLAKFLSEDRAGIADHAALRREAGLMERLNGLDIVPQWIRLRGGGISGVAYEPKDSQMLSLLVERNGSLTVDVFLALAIRFCDHLSLLHERNLLAASFHPARWLWSESADKLWFLGLETTIDLSVEGNGDGQGRAADDLDFGLDELVYMSPEQFGTLPYETGLGSDIYGLGCLFFYLLCGRPPFRGSTRLELAHEQLAGQGLRLKQYRPHLPTALCQIVEQMMQPNPDNRYRSCNLLRRDLELCQRKKERGQLDLVSIGRRERQARLTFPERYYGDVKTLSRLREVWQRAIADNRQAILLTGPSHEMQATLVEELRQTVLVTRGLTILVHGDQNGQQIAEKAGSLLREVLEKVACALPSLDGDYALAGTILAELRPEAVPVLRHFAPGLADLFGYEDKDAGKAPSLPIDDNLIVDLVVELFDCLLMPGRPLLLVLLGVSALDELDAAILRRLMDRPGPRLMLVLGRQVVAGDEMRKADRLGPDGDQLLPFEIVHIAAMTRPQLGQYLAETLSVTSDAVDKMADSLMRKCEAWPEEIRNCLRALEQAGGVWYEPVWQRWTWSGRRLDAMAPATVKRQRLIAGIEAMRGDMKEVLRAAATHDGFFDLQSVVALSGLEMRYVRAAIAEARKRGILISDPDLLEAAQRERRPDLAARLASGHVPARISARDKDGETDLDEFGYRIWRFTHTALRQAAGQLGRREENSKRYVRLLLDLFWQGRLAEEQLPVTAGLVLDLLPQLDPEDYPVVADMMIAVSGTAGEGFPADRRAECRQVSWSLLPRSDWEEHHRQGMFIGVRILESPELDNDTPRFEAMLAELMTRCRNDEERFHLHLCELDRLARIGEQDAVVSRGLDILSGMGIWLPLRQMAPLRPLAIWWSFIRGGYISGSVKGLANVMEPGRNSLIMDVAGRVLRAVTDEHDPVMEPLVLLMLRLTRHHGLHAASGLAMALYAQRVANLPGARAQAKIWGQLPLELAQTGTPPLAMARICRINGEMEEARGNIPQALSLFGRGYELCRVAAERKQALLCGHLRLEHGFFAGLPLDLLRAWKDDLGQEKAAHEFGHEFGRESGMADIPNDNEAVHYALDMLLTGKAQAEPSDDLHGVLVRILLQCLVGDFARAQDIWQEQFPDSDFDDFARHGQHAAFILMLVFLAADHDGGPGVDQNKASRYLRSLEKKTRLSGSIYGARLLILQAELLRRDGRQDEALDLLEQAMGLARQNDNHIEEILASLRLADILDHPGREEERRRALRFARNAVLSWGSAPVAAILEERYREFLMGPLSEHQQGDSWQTAGGGQSRGLDLEAMAEATRIISGEVRLGELLKKMMRMVAGVAAAERALLILESDGEWLVQAELSGANDQVAVLENRVLSPVYVATSIVHYVVRTAEPVVLDDAGRDQTFGNDPYLLRQAPRSLLCLPLLNQSSIRAVLYLENNIVSGAFANRSVEVLSLLSAQMAVSIENARLYERMEAVNSELRDLNVNLEHTISERTSALIDKTAVLESTFETMRDGLIAFDGNGLTREYNSEILRMFGLPPGIDLQDQDYRTVFRSFVRHAIFDDTESDEEETRREIDILTDPLIKNPERTEYELEIRTASGRNLQLQFRRLNDGEGWMLKCVDVTQDRQRESELRSAMTRAESANEAKSRFLATMSHEIRTPMNGVMGMIDLLRDTRLNNEQQELTRIVGDSAGNLLNIIDEILDFSKIEAGKLSIELLEFELRDLVGQVIELMAPRANMKSLELAVHIDPDIPELLSGDPVRIRQVLINLLGNAVKFTATGHVALVVTTDQDLGEARSLRFEIRDTGIGLSEDAKTRLFEAFEQADASTTRRFGGTGLGLAISRNLVELMGGQISLESKEGKGSVFWFTLPFQVLGDKSCSDYVDLSGLVVGVAAELPVLQSGLEAMLHRCGVRAVQPGSRDWGRVDLVILDEFRHPGDTIPDRVSVIRLYQGDPPSASADTEVALSKPVRRRSLLQEVAILTGRASRDDFEKERAEPVRNYLPPSRKEALESGALLLVAEDNETNRTVIERQLKRLGIACDIVEDGVQAWDALQEQNYGLLLTDCHMPEMDGYELTGRIRGEELSDESRRRLPVVALTANALAGESVNAIQRGMDDFLTKPVKLDALEAVLLKWLPVLDVLRQQPLADQDIQDDVLADMDGGDDFVMDGTDGQDAGGIDAGPRPDILNLELVLSVFGALDGDAMQMIQRFVDTTGPDVTALMGLDDPDPEVNRHIIHQIAGAARTAGAIKVAETAVTMEQKILAGELSQALAMRDQLQDRWREVENFVHELAASL